MKKTILAAAAALTLISCGANPNTASGDNTAIWNDPATGCNYILYENGIGYARVGSLSIRFRADGKPDCPGSPPEGEWPAMQSPVRP